ncbi:MAG: VOC family protein [Candidatus Aquilonibacter sp.]
MSTKATGIDAIYYSVDDVPRAATFYKGLLDVKETTWENEHGAEWILSDGSAFGIGRIPGTPHVPSGTVLFAVPDAAALTSRVTELGGELTGDLRDLPPCLQQWCLDPDGNVFVLHQRKN